MLALFLNFDNRNKRYKNGQYLIIGNIITINAFVPHCRTADVSTRKILRRKTDLDLRYFSCGRFLICRCSFIEA